MIKNKILVLISSARTLPLKSPTDHPQAAVGFFLVELAKMLQEFGKDHEFIFATPDGQAPQLDINGFDLNLHVQGPKAAFANGISSLRNSDIGWGDKIKKSLGLKESVEAVRQKRSVEFARRESELTTAIEYLGRMTISTPLANTNPEAKLFAQEAEKRLQAVPQKSFLSLANIIKFNRDPNHPFKLKDFKFLFLPGGHAPMVDFRDNAELGEVINLLHENKTLIAPICHGPVSLTSARKRIDAEGRPVTLENFPLKGTKVTTVSKFEESLMLKIGYIHIPHEQDTRLEYFVDEALKEAGYDVVYGSPMALGVQPMPGYPQVIYDQGKQILTGNGPQAMDQMVTKLREIFPNSK